MKFGGNRVSIKSSSSLKVTIYKQLIFNYLEDNHRTNVLINTQSKEHIEPYSCKTNPASFDISLRFYRINIKIFV